MSQFGGVSPGGLPSRRRSAPAIEPNPVDRSLVAPGEVAAPPVSQGAILAAQLGRSLGLVGAVSEQYAQNQRIAAAEQRRIEHEAKMDAAERERLAEKAQRLRDAEDRVAIGVGVQKGREKLPVFKSAIGQQEQIGDPEQNADAVLRTYLASNPMDPKIAEGFSSIRDELVASSVARRDFLVAQAKTSGAADLASFVASGMLPPLAAVESASVLGLTPTQIDTAVLRDAAELAASRGDEDAVNAITGAMSREYPDLTVTLQSRLRSAEAGLQKQIHEASKSTLDRLNYAGAPYEAVKTQADELVNAGKLDVDDALTRVNTARDLAHRRIESVFGNAVTDGTIDEAGLREQFKNLSLDPLAPNYLSQDTRNSLINRSREKVNADLAKTQAAQAIGGASVVLNESQHGTAIAELVGPKGAGIIDAAGRIADPAALAVALARADMNPVAVRQTITGNLQSTEPARVIAAAQTVGLLARSGSQAWADLYEHSTTAGERVQMLKARMEFEAGNGVVDPAAAQRIRDIAMKVQDNPELAKIPDDAALKAEFKIDLAKESKRILNTVRSERPWTADTLLGIDWINPDPTLTDFAGQADRSAQRWFREYFTIARLTEPVEKAKSHAAEYAQSKLAAEYDYVRWGGEVRIMPAKAQDGTPLPPAWRWGMEHEAQAREELSTIAPTLGVPPSAITSMRPYAGGNGTLGWAYLLDDGSVLTDPNGGVILWTPTTDTAAKNEKAIADRKQAAAAERERIRRTTGYPIGY